MTTRTAPGSAGDAATVHTDVGTLEMPRHDTMMLPWFRRFGGWERHESALLNTLLRPGGTLLDIGAHVGYYTLRGLRRVGSGGAVFAVEPWAPLRRMLERNAAANFPDRTGSLRVIAGAAWHTSGPLRLALDEGHNTGDSRIAEHGSVQVDGVRLGELAELRAHRLSVVKSDAQGRDHHALAGVAELLQRDRPHVLCEFWPAGITDDGSDPLDVLAVYRSWGYEPKLVLEDYACPQRHACVRSHRADASFVDLARRARGGFATLWLCPNF